MREPTHEADCRTSGVRTRSARANRTHSTQERARTAAQESRKDEVEGNAAEVKDARQGSEQEHEHESAPDSCG